jgi:hypothetical protein
LPPAGAPGAQSVPPQGMIALGRAFAGQGMHFLFMSTKLFPPGEEYDTIHKAYSILSKHFRKQELPQGAPGMPNVPQFPGMDGGGGQDQGAPGGGAGAPPTATPNLPRGPMPMPMGG